MLQLVYASSAVDSMSPSTLKTLLEKARKKNDRLGVTGMLLYRDGRFLQALEGDEQVVRSLYETIREDERHASVVTLRDRFISERDFPDWTMGFKDLDRADPEELPEGYSPFMKGDSTPAHFRDDPSQAHQALLQFRDAVVS